MARSGWAMFGLLSDRSHCAGRRPSFQGHTRGRHHWPLDRRRGLIGIGLFIAYILSMVRQHVAGGDVGLILTLCRGRNAASLPVKMLLEIHCAGHVGLVIARCLVKAI
jgi:hypothetical protein